MAYLNADEKAKLKHFAQAGDLGAQGYQDLKAANDALTARVAALEAALTALTARVAALE